MRIKSTRRHFSGLMQSGDRLGSRTTVSLNQLYLAKNRPKAKVVNPQLRTISEGPERPQICSVPRRCASVDDSGNQTSVTGSSNCSSNESVSASKSAKNDNEETTKNPIAQLIRSIRRLSTKGRSSGGHSESDPEAMLSCSPANDRQLESSK